MTPRDYLAGLEFHGIKLGLDNIRALAGAAGGPHLRYPTLHVAGTNGKGSAAAFAASVLGAAGYRVGRFTSPHLLDVSERFLIGGDPISDDDLNRHIEFFRAASHGLPGPPTYFEMCTAIAFRHFAEAAVDVAVIEVGMGGRFDSTNIVVPEVCAITNIALDHMKYLGDTLEAIAFEKAGIVKPGVPVITGEQTPGPFGIIERTARERTAPLLLQGRDFTCAAGGDALRPTLTYRGPRFAFADAPLGLAGMHQVENAAIAVAMIEAFSMRHPVSEDAVVRGLAGARWPCRLERVLDDPPVYIDAAHNPAGIQRLVESMPPCSVVFAASSDKDVEEMLRGLQPIARTLVLTEFGGTRALPVAQLERAAAGIPFQSRASLEDAFALAIQSASPQLPLLVAGSIFTAAQARRILVRDYGATPLRF